MSLLFKNMSVYKQYREIFLVLEKSFSTIQVCPSMRDKHSLVKHSMSIISFNFSSFPLQYYSNHIVSAHFCSSPAIIIFFLLVLQATHTPNHLTPTRKCASILLATWQ
mmetsp:Transcript_24588/g.36067  ORF Transcript_24588/g.36067 Transcript_24588/m.36067 type:complete len:108 (-) Transcript_24588:309-632(-)